MPAQTRHTRAAWIAPKRRKGKYVGWTCVDVTWSMNVVKGAMGARGSVRGARVDVVLDT
jgi:hypothetical protein